MEGLSIATSQQQMSQTAIKSKASANNILEKSRKNIENTDMEIEEQKEQEEEITNEEMKASLFTSTIEHSQ